MSHKGVPIVLPYNVEQLVVALYAILQNFSHTLDQIVDRVSTGTVTIADTATTANVVLSPAQVNTNFVVQVTVSRGVGAPVISQASVEAVTVNGFTVRVQTAPGAGNSVVVSWMLVRGDDFG